MMTTVKIPCTNPNSGVRFHLSESVADLCCRRGGPNKTGALATEPPSLVRAPGTQDEIELLKEMPNGTEFVSNITMARNDDYDGTVLQEVDPHGVIVAEYWIQKDHVNIDSDMQFNADDSYYSSWDAIDRKNGPAIIKRHPNGMMKSQEWIMNGTPHREDGPAVENWNDQGVLTSQYWFFNGEPHRAGGPATLEFAPEDGSLALEEWYLNGREHRDDGPQMTYIAKLKDGSNYVNQHYSVQGKSCSKENFLKYRELRDLGMPEDWAFEVWSKENEG